MEKKFILNIVDYMESTILRIMSKKIFVSFVYNNRNMLNQGVKNPNFWRILPKYGIYDVTIRDKNGRTGKI